LAHYLALPRALFAVADYRRIWTIGLLTGITRWLELLALGIYAYDVTSSPEVVALLALLRMAPFVVFGFFIGALTDMIDRKRWLIAAIGMVLVSSGGMIVAAFSGFATIGLVAVATVISGIFWVTDMPLRRRLLVETIDHQFLTSASAFDAVTNYITRVIGPLIGGAAYQWFGIIGIFAFSTAVYLVCLLLALRLEKPVRSRAGGNAVTVPDDRPIPGNARHVAPTFQALTFAWKMFVPPAILLRNRQFMIILGITAVYNIWCFPLIAMVPVIAERDFGLSPVLVGALSACDGIGGTIGAVMVGMLATNRSLMTLYFLGPTCNLILLSCLAWFLSVEMATLALLCAGVAAACFSSTQYALVYHVAPPEMRGRATGLLSMFIGTGALGLYNTGFLFATFTSAHALTIMVAEGSAAILLLAVAWLAMPTRKTPAN